MLQLSTLVLLDSYFVWSKVQYKLYDMIDEYYSTATSIQITGDDEEYHIRQHHKK